MTDQEYQEEAEKLAQQIEQTKTVLAATSQGQSADTGWWSTSSAMTMSSAVLLFGSLICVVSAYLLSKGQSADSILRTFGTILIIVAALFLVVAGYSDRQIAPVMGLLGTIAGYLLGKSTNEPRV